MIRVVLAEDQALVLGAIASLLNLEPDIQVVGCALDGPAALHAVRSLHPSVLVSDVEMPGLSGIEVANAITAEKIRTRVLIVTTFGRAGYLRRALDSGVYGYLLKDTPADGLANAVRTVASGGRVLDAELAKAASYAEPDPLSDRERAVLRLAYEGQSNKNIGRALGLSPGTVRNYLSEAAAKLGAGNRIEASRFAWLAGFL